MYRSNVSYNGRQVMYRSNVSYNGRQVMYRTGVCQLQWQAGNVQE